MLRLQDKEAANRMKHRASLQGALALWRNSLTQGKSAILQTCLNTMWILIYLIIELQEINSMLCPALVIDE